jgi:signal transduction histidine kinase/CheY-like chemotaxis protein
MNQPDVRHHEERFLVVARTARDASLTCNLVRGAGLECEVVADVAELCAKFEEGGGAGLMITEELLGPPALARLVDVLSRQSSWSDVPVLLFTASSVWAHASPLGEKELASLGNVTLLERPLRPLTMLSAARAALRARRRQYQARAELFEQQRAVRLRDQFLAMLGHELRNPLAAITMAIELEHGRTPSKRGDILRRQVTHLARLVDDLLDVSRVTSGKVILRRVSTDLAALVERCAGAITGQANVRVHVPSEAVYIHADPVRLEQIVTNLLTNAAKYTPAGGDIDVTVAVDGELARLEVRDRGIGIAPDMLDRVFDLFTQVEGSLDRSKGGMGIGLTLVRSLVELHGGTVKAASQGIGTGSTFTVLLPRGAARPDEAAAISTTRSQPRTSIPARDVLVVEDHDDSRDLLVHLLAGLGHHVRAAADGPSGLAEALAHPPEIMLVDIGLPGLDGYEVARRLRSSAGDAAFLVALTGYGQPGDRALALEAGFDVHLTKPVAQPRIEEVLGAAQAALEMRSRQLPAARKS